MFSGKKGKDHNRGGKWARVAREKERQEGKVSSCVKRRFWRKKRCPPRMAGPIHPRSEKAWQEEERP